MHLLSQLELACKELTVFGQTLLACWGIPLWVSSSAFAACLVLLAMTGSYAVAEKATF